MSLGAAGAVAAAAAEIQRQEEEEMTPYSDKDLAESWEFKIVRSNFGTFRKPEALRQLLEEERRGGWVLVEKFDDCRIRLKRPAGMKVVEGDFADGYDPYRTTVSVPHLRLRLLIALLFAVLVMFCMILTAFAVGR